MRANGLGEAGGIDDLAAIMGRLQNLQVALRQQLAGFDVASIAPSCTLYSEAPSAVAECIHRPAAMAMATPRPRSACETRFCSRCLMSPSLRSSRP